MAMYRQHPFILASLITLFVLVPAVFTRAIQPAEIDGSQYDPDFEEETKHGSPDSTFKSSRAETLESTFHAQTDTQSTGRRSVPPASTINYTSASRTTEEKTDSTSPPEQSTFSDTSTQDIVTVTARPTIQHTTVSNTTDVKPDTATATIPHTTIAYTIEDKTSSDTPPIVEHTTNSNATEVTTDSVVPTLQYTTARYQFYCPKNPDGECIDGIYADLELCETFYHCSNCIAYRKVCPAGLHFHPVFGHCDHPPNVNCRTGVRCAALPTPDNADKLVWQDEIYGGATIFACKDGFTLVGDELRTCLGSGQWSGEQPVCIPTSSAAAKPTHQVITTTQNPLPPRLIPTLSTQFRCPRGPAGQCVNGLFADLEQCGKFYHCSNCIPYRKDCPDGLHFNPKIDACDHQRNVDCKPIRISTKGSTTTSKAHTTTERPKTTNCPPVNVPGYRGCYSDSEECRIMITSRNSTMVTIDGCLNYCIQKSRTDNFNYMYAGLQNANQCWCGMSGCSTQKLANAECSRPCAGDKRQICGGVNRMSMYRFDTTTKEKRVK